MRTLEEERAHKALVDNEVSNIKRELKLQAAVLGTWLTTFWGVYLVNNVWLDNWFGRTFALQARHLDSLFGVLATPFLHTSASHVLASSISVAILGWWVMMRDTRDFFMVHLTAMLTSGLALWLFAPSAATTWYGWGGISFGMAGYLLTSGVFERRWGMSLSSAVAMFLLGGAALSVMIPGTTASLVGEPAGLLGGVLVAAFLGWRRRKVEDPEDYLGSKAPSVSEMAGTEETTFDFDHAVHDAVEEVVQRR